MATMMILAFHPLALRNRSSALTMLALIFAATTRPAQAEPAARPVPVDAARAAPAEDDRWTTQLGDGDPSLAHGPPRSTDRDLPAGVPAIGAVLTAAYATAGLDHDPSSGWLRRARLSGLVPWLTVRTTRDTSWQDDQSEVGHSTTLELRATWRLDRLLFDSRELQVASVEAARHRERRRLSTRVIRAYFTWRRAASVASDSDDRAAIRLAEVTAELDALTDGWFSDELAGHRRPR